MEPTKIIELLNQIPGISNCVSAIVGGYYDSSLFKKKH